MDAFYYSFTKDEDRERAVIGAIRAWPICNICGRKTEPERMVLEESRFNEPEPKSEYCIDCLNNEGNE